MNIKKYLRQQAEKDAEKLLTESDRQFCMELAKNAQQYAPKRKKFNVAAVSSAAAACLVALVLGITLPLTLNKQPVADEIHYKQEDIAQTACTVEDVNLNSKYFTIEETEDTTFLPMLNYDSVSGDKLYYSVRVVTEISTFTLDVVINENYNYIFEVQGELLREQLLQYNIEYNQRSIDGVMSKQLKYTGSIKVEAETVYIDYTQKFELGDYADRAFFDDIQNVLKVNN